MSQPAGPAVRERTDVVNLAAELEAALHSRGQLRLQYQPRVAMQSGRCVGVEALLRWRHPVLGDIPPDAFLPFVEGITLMNRLTDWVLDTALTQIAAWRAAGLSVGVAVNISTLDLELGYLAGRVAELLRRHGVPAAALEVEFTESRATRDMIRARQQLLQLSRMGIRIALDDFGIGFSNFTYLREIPADTVKLDRSLITAVAEVSKDAVIVGAMIRMIHALGCRVIAEGIETQETYDWLVGSRCDEGQGFLIGRPMSAEDVAPWIMARQPAAAAIEQ